jgi:hypothetical protein
MEWRASRLRKVDEVVNVEIVMPAVIVRKWRSYGIK